MRRSPNTIRINITVRVGEQVMQVTDSRPLVLSGDRRRWRRQIEQAVQAQAEVLSTRFGGDAIISTEAASA